MSEPTKPTEPVKIDTTAALAHLDKVDLEVAKRALDDKGEPKAGCNASFHKKNITTPLRKLLETSPSAELVKEALAVKPEEPTVEKFFKHPLLK